MTRETTKTTKLENAKFADGVYDVYSKHDYEVCVIIEGQDVDLNGSRYEILVAQGTARFDEALCDLILDRCSTCHGIKVEKVA